MMMGTVPANSSPGVTSSSGMDGPGAGCRARRAASTSSRAGLLATAKQLNGKCLVSVTGKSGCSGRSSGRSQKRSHSTSSPLSETSTWLKPALRRSVSRPLVVMRQ